MVGWEQCKTDTGYFEQVQGPVGGAQIGSQNLAINGH